AVTNDGFYIQTDTAAAFAYDGYTTPITATFNAIGGVTYHMIIAISDIGDSFFDSAVFLEKQSNTSQDVNGIANTQTGPMEQGEAELFGYSIDPGAFPRIDSTAIGTGGNFSFHNVTDGLYLVHILPDTSVYTLSVPTYFGGAYLWEDAQSVAVACDAYATSATSMVITTGPGGISGVVGTGAEGFRLRSEELIPVGDVSVFLQDSASTELRGYTRSDANGMYHFSNLAYGTYYVLPDKAGVPLAERRKVILSASNEQVDHISFQLTMGGVLNVSDVVVEPLIETGASVEWTVTGSYTYYSVGTNAKIRLGGDTLINDTLYQKLYIDGVEDAVDIFDENEKILLGGIRQEGASLYLRYLLEQPWNSSKYNKDLLYFRSDLQVGDTLHTRFSDENNSFIEITSIDTITLNGVERTRWKYIENYYGLTESFVQGIGNSSGWFNLGYHICACCPYLVNVCWSDANGVSSFYQDVFEEDGWFNFNECFLISGGISEIPTLSLELSPNPGNGLVNLQLSKQEEGSLNIYDVSGRLQLTQIVTGNQSIDLGNLSAGVYIVEFKNNQRQSGFTRWIKE
ncbi:MAG: hypothetical protein RLZZ543_485, partial [Bacteroidota bacterium]